MKQKGPKSGKFASGAANGKGKLKFNNGLQLDANETLCANRTILLSVTAVENTTTVVTDNTTAPVSLFQRRLVLAEVESGVAVTFGSEGYGEPVLSDDNSAAQLFVSFFAIMITLFAL